MSLIEGVGDEVVQFAVMVVVGLVAAFAWWSTNARSDHYRTVFLMRSRTHHPVTVSIHTRTSGTNTQTSTISQSTSAPDSNATTDNIDGTVRENSRVIPVQEMDSIVDADMAMMDDDRMHFYRRIDSSGSSISENMHDSTSDESETQEENDLASNAQIREMDSIVSAMEADVTTGCEFFNNRSNGCQPTINKITATNKGSSSSVKENDTITNSNIKTDNIVHTRVTPEPDSVTSDDVPREENVGDNHKIHIKLKYLNDTFKEVEGSLNELLKDFKWRHFSTELTAELRVRLIFNGRVLSDDTATLRACGLQDRAVVHCLVHPQQRNHQHQRATPEQPALPELVPEPVLPERSWDLENILMTLVSVALTVVWFVRCEYSNMFTASASVALFGLTVFYSVAVFGLYISDTFYVDRRATQPVPNN